MAQPWAVPTGVDSDTSHYLCGSRLDGPALPATVGWVVSTAATLASTSPAVVGYERRDGRLAVVGRERRRRLDPHSGPTDSVSAAP